MSNLPASFRDMAIVANGGSLAGAGFGERIDAHPLVGRFNNFSCAEEFQADVGAKTNVWITSFFGRDGTRSGELDFVQDSADENVEYVLCPIPFNNEMMKASLIKKYDEKTTFVPESVFNSLIQVVPKPSTGLALLWWMCESFGPTPISQIFGFDFFSAATPHHYRNGYRPPANSHDGNMERELFGAITVS